MRTGRFLTSCLIGGLLATPSLAQSTLDWPVGEIREYRLDSGNRSNPAADAAPLYAETVTVVGAAWLRLYFGKVELGPGSVVRMTSLQDNEVQELDAEGLAMWNSTSAYFNGEAVRLELIAGPNTKGNRVVLQRVALETAAALPAGLCGMCGADDRTPSNEDWSGRIMPVGCTGSIWNEESCVVSAGHCVGSDSVIQFRVPDSDGDCSTNQPPVAEQFPITDRIFQNDGVGNDWAVMTTGANNLGETAYERYGELRQISYMVPEFGDPVAVWGFGVDEQCTRSQTQQTHSGTIAGVTGEAYRLEVDITFGNSGSALIRDDMIIGIVTHCPCPNTATRIDRPRFTAARDELCPLPVVLPDGFTLLRGGLVSGGLEDLFDSDDDRLVMATESIFPLPGPPIQLEVRGTTSVDFPAELRFTIESRVNSVPVEQRILFFNHITQSYEEVDVRTASTSDTVIEIVITSNPGRFVELGTGLVKALVTWAPEQLGIFLGLMAEVDQSVWEIRP
ncbi:MAG: trypsin-like serine protease [Planctomycetota bacterium]